MLLSFKRVYCEAKFHISPAEMDYMVSILYILTQQTLEEAEENLKEKQFRIFIFTKLSLFFMNLSGVTYSISSSCNAEHAEHVLGHVCNPVHLAHEPH